MYRCQDPNVHTRSVESYSEGGSSKSRGRVGAKEHCIEEVQCHIRSSNLESVCGEGNDWKPNVMALAGQ